MDLQSALDAADREEALLKIPGVSYADPDGDIVVNGYKIDQPEYKVFIEREGTETNDQISISAYLPENFSSSITSQYDAPFENKLAEMVGDKVSLGMRLAGLATSTQKMSIQVWQGSAPMEFSIPLNFLLDSDSEKDIYKPWRQLMAMALPSRMSNNPNGLGLESPGPKIRFNNKDKPPTTADRLTEKAGVKSALNQAASSTGSAIDQGKGLIGSVMDVATGKQTINTQEIVQAGVETMDSAANAVFGLFEGVEVYDNISLTLGKFLIIPSVVITDVSQDLEIKVDRYTKMPIAITCTVGFRTFMNPIADDLKNMIPTAYDSTLTLKGFK